MGLFDYPAAATASAAVEPDFIFLENLSPASWKKILAHAETLSFARGQVLLHAGDSDDAFYIVTAGSVEVVLSGKVQGPALTVVPEGSVFGEIAFFDGQPRSAGIRARTNGTAIRISRTNFEHLSSWDAVLGRQILFDLGRILSVRLRWTTDLSQRR